VKNRQPLFGFQIKRNGALSSTGNFPEQGDVIGWIAPPHIADGVTLSRSLHLDDVSTKVGQVSGTTRSGKNRRDVDDA
jgi:hypothetical protein